MRPPRLNLRPTAGDLVITLHDYSDLPKMSIGMIVDRVEYNQTSCVYELFFPALKTSGSYENEDEFCITRTEAELTVYVEDIILLDVYEHFLPICGMPS